MKVKTFLFLPNPPLEATPNSLSEAASNTGLEAVGDCRLQSPRLGDMARAVRKIEINFEEEHFRSHSYLDWADSLVSLFGFALILLEGAISVDWV